jgi:hypothetical protein
MRGSNSISVSGHHNIKEGAAYCILHAITGRRGGPGGGGPDNLLMSMVVPYFIQEIEQLIHFLMSHAEGVT